MRLTLLLATALTLPALSQDYEVRVERFKTHFQELPQVVITFGDAPAKTGWIDQDGKAISAAFRISEIHPSVDFRLRFEYGSAKAEGFVQEPSTYTPVRITHKGLGIGLNWLFSHRSSGLALETELTERVWNYDLSSPVFQYSGQTRQTWFRLGGRWTLPYGKVRPFVSLTSEMILIGKDSPNREPLRGLTKFYLKDQHEGQESDRNHCLGFGLVF